MSCDARATTRGERTTLAPRRVRVAPALAMLAATVLTVLAALASGACGLEPRPVERGYALQASTRASLAARPDAADATAKLAQGLEQRFGAPEAPHGALPPRGRADDARLRADNRRAFARELAAIDAGAFDDVGEPRGHPALFATYRAAVARGDDRAKLRELFEGFRPTLAESAELYRIECAHCHGTSGGGDGPTARSVDPRPRDFRRGIFKWTSVKDLARPTHADLARVLERGAWGTAMPSFLRLSEAEREGLVEYVEHLAVRGEVERQVVLALEDGEELSDATFDDAQALVTKRWTSAATKVVAWDGPIPDATKASIELGDRLYHDARKGNCAACHGDRGRGDGPVAFKVDDRGDRVPAYQDAWGFDVLPRDLVRDPWRGGRRPIDLYRRLYAGINGGPMPAMAGNLTGEELWALVHYTSTLAELGGAR